ncbi:MAG: hypothetical protein WC413_02810 [Candidatus Nanoarchaeia archaeon]
MKKLEVLGMGNFKEFIYLIIKKDKFFFKRLSVLLSKTFDINYWVEQKEVKDETYVCKEIKKQIKDYVDKHEVYKTKEKDRIDIFYGKSKAFLIVHSNKKSKFLKVLNKLAKLNK